MTDIRTIRCLSLAPYGEVRLAPRIPFTRWMRPVIVRSAAFCSRRAVSMPGSAAPSAGSRGTGSTSAVPLPGKAPWTGPSPRCATQPAGRLLSARGWDRPHAFAAITEAVWWVTMVDATLVRYHPEIYGEVLASYDSPERKIIEDTFAGLRYVRSSSMRRSPRRLHRGPPSVDRPHLPAVMISTFGTVTSCGSVTTCGFVVASSRPCTRSRSPRTAVPVGRARSDVGTSLYGCAAT